MITKKKKILRNTEEDFLLPEKELARVQKKYSNPHYSGGSLVLDESASVLDKTKYEICQIILTYKQKNRLSVEEIIQQTPPRSKIKVEDVLYCRIDKFTLDKLVAYAEWLLPALQVKAIAPRFLSSRKSIFARK